MASSTSTFSCSGRSSSVSLILLILASSIFCTTVSNGKANDDDDQDQQHMKPPWIKSVMSLTETAFPNFSMYLEKGRVALKMVHDYVFRPTPDIDFRSSAKDGDKGGVTASDIDVIEASKVEKGGGGGVGERVKEAASKSLEKSKSTFEESAKRAGDAIHEVKDKLKKSFEKTKDSHRQLEL